MFMTFGRLIVSELIKLSESYSLLFPDRCLVRRYRTGTRCIEHDIDVEDLQPINTST